MGGDEPGLARQRRGGQDLGTEDGLHNFSCKAIGEDSGGNLWVGSRRGLARASRSPASPFRRPLARELPAPATAPRHGPAGRRSGSARARGSCGGTDGATRVYGAADGLVSPRVQVLYRDHEGTLWVGTAGGLFRFDNGRFVALSRDGGGLSSNEVDAICEDREGSLWVGTRDGGLNRLKDERIANYTVRQGLSDDRVWSVFEDRSGNMWAGSADGNLSRLAPEAAAFAFVANLGAPVRAIDQDPLGDLWVGTRGNGVYRLHGKRSSTTRPPRGLGDPGRRSPARRGGV